MLWERFGFLELTVFVVALMWIESTSAHRVGVHIKVYSRKREMSHLC